MPWTGLPDRPPGQPVGARSSAWALGFAFITLLAQSLSASRGGWQFVRSDYAAGAWWQLFSAQWVHLGWMHAGVNVAGMAVLLVLFRDRVDGRLQWLALLGGYLGVALVLALDADCAWYAGASGALHGLLAGNLLGLWLRTYRLGAEGRHTAWLAFGVLVGLVLKLLVQHQRGDVGLAGWLGFASYYPAHEAGAAGGLLAVALARATARWPGSASRRQ